MGRQKGIHRIKGAVGDGSYYKTKKGYQVREKSGVDGNRIKNDPAYARTRENGAEFGALAKAGRLLRSAIGQMLNGISKSDLSNRVTRTLSGIKNLDTSSARGMRNVSVGISGINGKALLKGFNFNENAPLDKILLKGYSVTLATGAISIPGLIPVNDLVYPPEATHVSFSCCFARLDFSSGDKEVFVSNAAVLPINGTVANVALTPAGTPSGLGTDFFLLKVEFLQERSGVKYVLQNSAFNSLCIVDVQ